MNETDVKTRLYPETAAGGFSRVDGTVEFYQRVNALLTPELTVLDFGAGRGALAEDPAPYRRALRCLRGRVARVVGVDIDESVLRNPEIDEAFVISQGGHLPFEDAAIDLIVSDFTFEHVTDPGWAAREIKRVMRPGGWLCARTPNRWGYIGVAARLVPNQFHERVLRLVQPQKRPEDTFPTAYRLNSVRSLRRHFDPSSWDHFVYTFDAEPAYFGSSRLAWRLMQSAQRVTPPALGSMLHVFLRKH